MTESERATVAWYERGLEALEERLAALLVEVEATPGRLAERMSDDLEAIVSARIAADCGQLDRENARVLAEVVRLRAWVRELAPGAIARSLELESEGSAGADPAVA